MYVDSEKYFHYLVRNLFYKDLCANFFNNIVTEDTAKEDINTQCFIMTDLFYVGYETCGK